MTTLFGLLMPCTPALVPVTSGQNRAHAERTADAVRLATKTIASFRPDTAVLVTPHAIADEMVCIMGGDQLYGTFRRWGSDLSLRAQNDRELAEAAAGLAREEGVPLFVLGERAKPRHGIASELDLAALVPLFALREAGYDGRVLHLSVPRLPLLTLYRAGMILQQAGSRLGRKLAVIASGPAMDHPSAAADSSPEASVHPPDQAAADAFLVDCIRYGRWLDLLRADMRADKRSEMRTEMRGNPPAASGPRVTSCLEAIGPLAVLLGCFESEAIHPSLLMYEAPNGVGHLTATFLRCDIEDRVDSLYRMLTSADTVKTFP